MKIIHGATEFGDTIEIWVPETDTEWQLLQNTAMQVRHLTGAFYSGMVLFNTTTNGLKPLNTEIKPSFINITEAEKKAEKEDIIRRADALLQNHPARMNKDTDLNP
jgi:hypothetical protein